MDCPFLQIPSILRLEERSRGIACETLESVTRKSGHRSNRRKEKERGKWEREPRACGGRPQSHYVRDYVGILIRVAAEVQPVGNACAVASLARNPRTVLPSRAISFTPRAPSPSHGPSSFASLPVTMHATHRFLPRGTSTQGNEVAGGKLGNPCGGFEYRFRYTYLRDSQFCGCIYQ